MCIYIYVCIYIYIYIYVYITRLASNEIFSPSNKIHLEVGRAKDLSAPRHYRVKEENTNVWNIWKESVETES